MCEKCDKAPWTAKVTSVRGVKEFAVTGNDQVHAAMLFGMEFMAKAFLDAFLNETEELDYYIHDWFCQAVEYVQDYVLVDIAKRED